jgi:hypothetical protein
MLSNTLSAIRKSLRGFDKLTLTVEDNGAGCPDDSPRGVGSHLVELLVGKNEFTCVKVPTRPLTPLDGPSLTCSGGKVDKGKCVCPQGTIMTTAGKNQYVCKAPLLVR